MSRKMMYLQNVNFDQQDKLREMDVAKKETGGNIVQMHDKLSSLNQRLRSQGELQKYKEDKHLEKIEQLEKRIELLTGVVEKERTKKVKPLPYQRAQKLNGQRKKSSRGSRERSLSVMSAGDAKKKCESVRSARPQRSQSANSRRKPSSQRRVPAGPPRLSQNRGMSDVDQDVTLKLMKSSSPKHARGHTSSAKYNNIPFVPLRNSHNRGFVQKKLRNPSMGYMEYAQDLAGPTDNEMRTFMPGMPVDIHVV
mgnify:CR=1 FL=1